MNQKKQKKFKAFKKYKPPPEKFLVVVNPWGSHGSPRFFDNVGAWFERMLLDDYPETRINMIYTQGTHTNIIVELPEEVDVVPFLGAHPYARFLNAPYNTGTGVAYIYEYNYELYDHPSRRNWASDSPSYTTIVQGFPVKSPYPAPIEAPPPPRDASYAKRPPEDLQSQLAIPPPAPPHTENLAISAKRIFQSRDPGTIPTVDTKQPSTPPPLQRTTPPIPRAKHDPTEEAGVLLRSLLPIKKEPETAPTPLAVKKRDPYEEDEAAEGLLRSHPVKEEESSHDHLSEEDEDYEGADTHDDYKPSAELLATFAMLPPDLASGSYHGHRTLTTVKEEPSDDGYRPSEELLASFETLSPDLNAHGSAPEHPPARSHRVKEEHVDGDHLLRDSALGTDKHTSGAPKTPTKSVYGFRVKAEPQDDMLPSLTASRDPRKRARDCPWIFPELCLLATHLPDAIAMDGVKRPRGELAESFGSSKRFKAEYNS